MLTHAVVFEGRTLTMVDETQPYAAKPMDYYTQTKIIGERLVSSATMEALSPPTALSPYQPQAKAAAICSHP